MSSWSLPPRVEQPRRRNFLGPAVILRAAVRQQVRVGPPDPAPPPSRIRRAPPLEQRVGPYRPRPRQSTTRPPLARRSQPPARPHPQTAAAPPRRPRSSRAGTPDPRAPRSTARPPEPGPSSTATGTSRSDRRTPRSSRPRSARTGARRRTTRQARSRPPHSHPEARARHSPHLDLLTEELDAHPLGPPPQPQIGRFPSRDRVPRTCVGDDERRQRDARPPITPDRRPPKRPGPATRDLGHPNAEGVGCSG